MHRGKVAAGKCTGEGIKGGSPGRIAGSGALNSGGYCKRRTAPRKYAGEASAPAQTFPPQLFGEGVGRNGKKDSLLAPSPWGERRSDTAASGTNAEILVGLDWCDMNYFS